MVKEGGRCYFIYFPIFRQPTIPLQLGTWLSSKREASRWTKKPDGQLRLKISSKSGTTKGRYHPFR